MTNEERAREIIAKWAHGRVSGDDGTPADPKEAFIIYLAAALDAAHSAGAAQERDRLAKLVESFITAPANYRDWSPLSAADDRTRKIIAAFYATTPTP